MTSRISRTWPDLAKTSFRVQVFTDGLRADLVELADTPEQAATAATGRALLRSGPPENLRAKVCSLDPGRVVFIHCFYDAEPSAFPDPGSAPA